MGDYASDANYRDMFASGHNIDWNEQAAYNPTTYLRFEFKEIKTETKKGWLVVMVDGIEIWLPKSKCSVEKNSNIIRIPKWLVSKINHTQP